MDSKFLFLPGLVMAALAFFARCSAPVAHPAPLRQPDTVHRAEANRDTGIAGRSQVKAETDSVTPSLKEIYDQYIAGYTAHCTIDSTFKLAGAQFKLHVDHSCTFDSAIVIPKNYVNIYKLDSFITHDFVTHITLTKNGKKILERTVSKKDFWLKYRPELSNYAVLFCPHLEIYLGEMILNYSISIPLTDVGASATANIDAIGAMSFHVGD